MQQEIHNCHHYDVHHIQNAKCRKCGKLGHIARVCRSSIALVVYNQSPELAVVTVTKTQEKQFIFTSLSCLYLLQIDKRLHLMVDVASLLTFINQKTWQNLQQPKLEPTSRVLGAFEGQPIGLRCSTQMILINVQF